MNIMRKITILPFEEIVLGGITKYICRLSNKRILVDDVNLLSIGNIKARDVFGNNRSYQYFINLDEKKYGIVEDIDDSTILYVVDDQNLSTMVAQQSAVIPNCTGIIDNIINQNELATTYIEYIVYHADGTILKGVIITNTIGNSMPYGILSNIIYSRLVSNKIDPILKNNRVVLGNSLITKNFGVNPRDIGIELTQEQLAAINAANNPSIENPFAVENTNHNNFLGLNDGDYKHLTSLEKTNTDRTIQADVDTSCSGLISGGVITANTLRTGINITAGVGRINDHSGNLNSYKRIIFNEQLDILPIVNGVNHVHVLGNGSINLSPNKEDMISHIYLGHIYVEQGYIFEVFSVPEFVGHFQGRINDFINNGIGHLLLEDCR